MNTTVLENKIEMLGRRLTDVMSALEAMAQPSFKVGSRYKLRCDIAHSDNFLEGDIVRAAALDDSTIADVMLLSERSEETIDLPLAKLDSWLRAGALEEV